MALSKNYENLIYMYYDELETTDLLWKTMQNYVSISKTMVPDQTINMVQYETLICNGKTMLSYKRLWFILKNFEKLWENMVIY